MMATFKKNSYLIHINYFINLTLQRNMKNMLLKKYNLKLYKSAFSLYSLRKQLKLSQNITD